jgi:hypothetical protein
VTHDQHDLQRSRQVSEMTNDEIAELFRMLKPETRGQHSARPDAGASTRYGADELALKLTTLEAELRGLRQVLKANPDNPRHEIEELGRNSRLAGQIVPIHIVKRRAWFCGRAAANI